MGNRFKQVKGRIGIWTENNQFNKCLIMTSNYINKKDPYLQKHLDQMMIKTDRKKIKRQECKLNIISKLIWMSKNKRVDKSKI